MDTVIERVKGVLSDPMIGEPSLEYFKMVETELHNCTLAAVQHLDLELKTFEFLAAEHNVGMSRHRVYPFVRFFFISYSLYPLSHSYTTI